MNVKIHQTAIIHPSAKLADGVEIGSGAVIGPEVVIGENTKVGPNCVIEYAVIGKNNVLTASAFIGTPPQDFSYKGERTGIIVGDNNIIRECVSLHRASKPEFVTKIGSGCMFMATSHVGHDCLVGDGVVMVNCSGLAGHSEVGDKAIISGMTGVHQFTRIGTMAMAGLGSMIVLDIPPYCRCQGDRAKLVGLNVVGMRRSGISRESIQSVKDAYKTLFFQGLTLAEALARLKASQLSPEAGTFVKFCEGTKRGITRPRLKLGKPVECDE